MRRTCLASSLLIGLAGLLSAGCSDDSKPAGKDLAVSKEAAVADAPKPDSPAKRPDSKAQTADTVFTPDRRLVDYDFVVCQDNAALLNEALTKGKKVFKGVSLTSSKPIADVLANMSQYSGTVVRIEGIITEVCPTAGCYVTLLDSSGQKLNLKVDDGSYDFRLHALAGNYAVGEGLPEPTGDHGPQVYIQNHGAMIGNILCPVP
jgi:hypothetical protein